jgi:O-antigen ligase
VTRVSVTEKVRPALGRALVRDVGETTAPFSRLLYLGTLGTVLWAPLAFGSVEPWALGILKVVAFALLIAWAIGVALEGRAVVSASPLQWPLYGGVALGVFQVLPLGLGPQGGPVSLDPFATRQTTLALLALALLFSMALVSLDNRERLRRAALAVFWLGFALSVFGIIQHLSGTTSIYWVRDVSHVVNLPFGPFVNKNHFAGLMELWLPIGLGLLIAGAVPRDARILTAFAGGVIGVAIVLSRSRAGTLSLIAELLFLGVIALTSFDNRGWSRRRRLAMGAVGIIVLALSISLGVRWIGSEPVVSGFSKLSEDIQSTDAISRRGIFEDTWSMIADRPGFGAGLGAYAAAFTAYGRGAGTVGVPQAHNDYLQVFADGGIIGVTLALLFAVFLSVSGMRGIRRGDPVLRGVAAGALAGCFGLLVHSIADFNLQIPSNALAFLFSSALVARAASIRSRDA